MLLLPSDLLPDLFSLKGSRWVPAEGRGLVLLCILQLQSKGLRNRAKAREQTLLTRGANTGAWKKTRHPLPAKTRGSPHRSPAVNAHVWSSKYIAAPGVLPWEISNCRADFARHPGKDVPRAGPAPAGTGGKTTLRINPRSS